MYRIYVLRLREAVAQGRLNARRAQVALYCVGVNR